MKRGHGVRDAALRDHIARAAFALAALGGHAQFELDVVKAQTGTNMSGDLAVRNPVADTDNHGGRRVEGWLLK